MTQCLFFWIQHSSFAQIDARTRAHPWCWPFGRLFLSFLLRRSRVVALLAQTGTLNATPASFSLRGGNKHDVHRGPFRGHLGFLSRRFQPGRYEPNRCYNFPQLDRRRNAKVDIYQHATGPLIREHSPGPLKNQLNTHTRTSQWQITPKHIPQTICQPLGGPGACLLFSQKVLVVP